MQPLLHAGHGSTSGQQGGAACDQAYATARTAAGAGCSAAPDVRDAASSPICAVKTVASQGGGSGASCQAEGSSYDAADAVQAWPSVHAISSQHSGACSPAASTSRSRGNSAASHPAVDSMPQACTPVSRTGSRGGSLGGRVVVVDAGAVAACADEGLLVQDVAPAAEDAVAASPVLVAPEMAGDAARSLLAWQLQQGLMTPGTAAVRVRGPLVTAAADQGWRSVSCRCRISCTLHNVCYAMHTR